MRRTLLLSILIAAASAMTGLVAAGRSAPSVSEVSAASTGGIHGAEPIPYPNGRWRLVPPLSLNAVMLWTSHILIRHESSDSSVTLGNARWKLEDPPRRTRAEALALANELSARAADAPSRFGELAAKYSEDITTAACGGALGGTRASAFLTDSALLDALAAMPVGNVSRVIETRHGFHILYRRSPPPDDRVSGRHIVIGHRDAQSLARISAPAPERTRADALAMARRVIGEFRTGSTDFQTLVERYSEHPDRSVGGDIGGWDLREPTIHERGLEALAGLKVGDVSEPVETRWGIEVLQRTDERSRAEYSARLLRFDFEPADPTTRAEAEAAANDAARLLAGDPEMFDELGRRGGAIDTTRWFEGRDEPGLTAAVKTLSIGEVGAPVVQLRAIVIPKRMPLAVPALQLDIQYELPTPDGLALNLMVEIATPRHILEELTSVRRARGDAGWTNMQERQLAGMLDRWAKASDLPAEASSSFAHELEALVGAPGAPYRHLLEVRFGDLLLGAEPVQLPP